MRDIWIAVIAVIAAWGGSIIAGIFNLKTKNKDFYFRSLIHKARVGYENLKAYNEIENIYIKEICKYSRESEESVKRRIRHKFRELYGDTSQFSKDIEPNKIKKHLDDIKEFEAKY